MKYFKNFLLIGLVYFASLQSVQAETPIQDNIAGDNYPTISLSVGNVLLDKSVYKAGEEIKGTFEVSNHSGFSLESLSFRTSIASDFKEMAPGYKIAQSILDKGEKQGLFSLKDKEIKKMSFKYKTSKSIGGEKLAVEVEIFTFNGHDAAFGDSQYISILNQVKGLNFTDAYVGVNNGKEFALGDGPTIYKDEKPSEISLKGAISNASEKTYTITPKIKIFTQENRKEVYDGALTPLTVKKGTSKFDLNIPEKNYVPGVYLASFDFFDSLGEKILPTMEVRYIVGGDVAVLHTLSINNNVLSKGDTLSVYTLLSGRPIDISKADSVHKDILDQGRYEIIALNENNETVAESKGLFNIEGDTEIKNELIASHAANSIKIKLKVYSRDNTLLLEHEQVIIADGENSTVVAQDKNLAIIQKIQIAVFLVGFIILVLSGYFLFRRKNNISDIRTLILVATFIGSSVSLFYSDTIASICSSHNKLSITSLLPYKNQEFEPDTEFYITGNVSYLACSNNPVSINIEATGPDMKKIVKDKYFSKSSGSGKYNDTDSHGNGWYWAVDSNGSTNNHFIIGPFMTPTIEGDYKYSVTVIERNGCYYKKTETVPIKVKRTNGSSGGSSGSSGCGAGTFYCDTTKSCLPSGTSCNSSGGATPDVANPLIPRSSAAPVTLKKTLEVDPVVVNKGGSCKIAWSNAFNTYDKYTVCTFTGPTMSSSLTFAASTTDVVNFTSGPLRADAIYKMSCVEVDDAGGAIAGTTQTSDGICRVNLSYKEVN